MKKQTILTAILAFSLSVVTACGEEEEETVAPFEPEMNEEQKDLEDEDEEIEEEEISFENNFPLTGKGTNEDVNHRAIGIMIENSLNARPQSGLTQADVVYEVLTEGTVTRFLAFYHSQEAESIGPVRSARDYFIHLNNGYDAVYSSAGGSPDALDMIAAGQVAHLSGLHYEGTYFERDANRSAPHNLYTDTERLYEGIENRGYDLTRTPPELPFLEEDKLNDEENVIDGKEVSTVTIDYGSHVNTVQYDYDDEKEVYSRSNGGEEIYDATTGERVGSENILIIEAPHRVIDSQHRRSIDIQSGGRALLLQKGVMKELEWRNDAGVILPYDGESTEPLVPGQTWLNIVPIDRGGIDGYVDVDVDSDDEVEVEGI